jgi:hypothetical protein
MTNIEKKEKNSSDSKTSYFSKAYSYFCTFDNFGQQPALLYNGEETYQTGPGALLSILMNISVVLCIYYRTKMLYTFKVYDLTTQQVILGESEL